MVNSSLFSGDIPGAAEVVRVAATDIATGVATPMAAGFVMLGAFVATTAVVSLADLERSVEQVVPSYRRQHVEANQRAIRAGAEAVTAGTAPLWGRGRVAS